MRYSILNDLISQLFSIFHLEAVSKPDCRYFNGREFAFA
jgi:hypothetical protein